MKLIFPKLPPGYVVSHYVDILDELIIKRNKLKSDIDELSVEYYQENDDNDRFPILSEILELRMKLTNLQNEIIDLQSSKLAMLRKDQMDMAAELILKNKKQYPGIW